jgi:hypothetical protein
MRQLREPCVKRNLDLRRADQSRGAQQLRVRRLCAKAAGDSEEANGVQELLRS